MISKIFSDILLNEGGSVADALLKDPNDLGIFKMLSTDENGEIVSTLTKNLKNRFAYQEKQGIFTGQMERLCKIADSDAKPATKAKRLYKMVMAPENSLANARKKYERKQRADYRNYLRGMSDPLKAKKLSEEQVRDALKISRSDVRRKVNKLLKELPEGSVATDKFFEFMSTEMKNVNKMSRNQMLSRLNTLQRIQGFDGLTVEGAKKQLEWAETVLGEAVKDMTREEHSAIWDYIQREQAIHSLTSGDSIADTNLQLNDENSLYAFNEDSNGRLRFEMLKPGKVAYSLKERTEIILKVLAPDKPEEGEELGGNQPDGTLIF